jgi:hypothetical protein
MSERIPGQGLPARAGLLLHLNLASGWGKLTSYI